MKKLFHNIAKTLMGAAVVAVAMAGVASCGAINDDLEPCPSGLQLRFVFDYNMLYANAFPSQVDCLTLFVYDSAGKLVASKTETSSVLADENWRMVIDLPAGNYTCVAYGGMACSQSTFHFVTEPTTGSALTSLSVEMDANCIDANPGKELHPLFYGQLATSVSSTATDYTEDTVYMMKDTNTIRILLQNVDGTAVDVDDFTFTITDDNTLLNWNNDVVAQSGITYSPWYTGQASSGTVEDTDTEAVLAVAQFSTSRLTTNTEPRLTITDNRSSQAVLSIPLINYLLLLRSENPAYANMPDQEFLDREDTWRMILFLDNGRWIDARIVINDWVVRLNNAQL